MEVGQEWELRDGDFRRREQTGSLPPRNPDQFVIGEPRVLAVAQPVVFPWNDHLPSYRYPNTLSMECIGESLFWSRCILYRICFRSGF